MKKSHFILLSFGVISIFFVAIYVHSKNDRSSRIMGFQLIEDDSDQEHVIENIDNDMEIAFDEENTQHNYNRNYISEKKNIITENEPIDVHMAPIIENKTSNNDTLSIDMIQDSNGLYIVNDELLTVGLVSEDSEVLLYNILNNYFSERIGKEVVEINILDNSIINTGTELNFVFSTNQGKYYDLNLSLYTSTYEIKEHIYKERVVGLDENDLLKSKQVSYENEINNSDTFSSEILGRIDDYVLDFFISSAIGRYKESYSKLSHDHLKSYIKDYKYEYYDFVSDMKLLEQKCTLGKYDAAAQGYIAFKDFYLVKVYIYNNGQILEDKWVTMFHNKDEITSIWLEDINCIDIWEHKYK